jgi:hypothetical protein
MSTFRKTYTVVVFLLAALLLLSACAPGQATLSPQDVQSTIAASVAQTVQAQNAQAGSGQPAAEAPTATFTPSPFPTLTPLATSTTVVVPTSSGGSSGGSGSTTPQYACDPDVQKRPKDNSVYKPGDTFDIKFTIENTGTATWAAGYDLVYFSGPNLAPAFPAAIQLPEMKPGDTFAVGPYDAVAPAATGLQVMTFKLQGGFCYPYIAIMVEQNR